MTSLFSPLELAPGLTLKNRVVMAPLTRCYAGPGLVPTERMADYYARRADAGLIVSEATLVCPEAQGYPDTPGLFNDEQERGFAAITHRVHASGGRMFCQLWHTGRAAHSSYSGELPIAPSPLALEGTLPRRRRLTYETPREMTSADFAHVEERFVAAARRAERAGFDGVELHGANGYLLDQFLHHDSNRRSDEYGGSPEAMVRFPLRVIDALLDACPLPLGVRLSPSAHVQMVGHPEDRAVFDLLLEELGRRRVCYVHLGHFDDQATDPLLGVRPGTYLRSAYEGRLVVAGGYDGPSAERALREGAADLVAFGRPFIANPDLVELLRQGRETLPYDRMMLARLD